MFNTKIKWVRKGGLGHSWYESSCKQYTIERCGKVWRMWKSSSHRVQDSTTLRAAKYLAESDLARSQSRGAEACYFNICSVC